MGCLDGTNGISHFHLLQLFYMAEPTSISHTVPLCTRVLTHMLPSPLLNDQPYHGVPRYVFLHHRYAQVFDSVGTGGTAVMVGVTKYTDKTSIRTWPLLNDEKTLTGSYVKKRREETRVLPPCVLRGMCRVSCAQWCVDSVVCDVCHACCRTY